MQFKVISSGNSKVVELETLSRSLEINSEVYLLQEKEIYLGVISHQTLVLFVTEFAEYALKNYSKRNFPEAETCIRLTRKWLEDRESVSNEELKAAAASATAASATAAAYAAYAAAAYANAAANAAAYAAANAAAYAAAAADAAGVASEKELLRQGTFILDFLKNGKHLFLV